MPLGPSQASPKLISEEGSAPDFGIVQSLFDTSLAGVLALASLNLAGRNLVPVFPQRSPPWLLTTAACGGLKSAPDCRPRRALLHLSYSYASPCGPALLVTQGRVGMWRGGCRLNISVAASFVWRCLSG